MSGPSIVSASPPARVSIVMPCYQGARVLQATLESVRNQTFRAWELFIVDDGSSDESFEIAEAFARRDSRIRAFKNPKNLGAEGNWNKALGLAQAPYVKLLCSDDLLAPTCLARQVAILDDPANQDVALVCARRDIIDPKGSPVFRNLGLRGLLGKRSGREVVRECVKAGTNLLGEPSFGLFRKSASDQVGLFSAKYPYMIDVDYWFRLLERGSFYGLPETLGSFRIWPGSWSTRLARQQFSQADGFFSEILERNGPGVVTPWERWSGRATLFLKCHLRRLVLNLQKLKPQPQGSLQA
jgi:glycosyltransferase involved in cell wall biosynthesis